MKTIPNDANLRKRTSSGPPRASKNTRSQPIDKANPETNKTERSEFRLGVFWRTFGMLALVLACNLLAWSLLAYHLGQFQATHVENLAVGDSVWLRFTLATIASLGSVALVVLLVNRPIKDLSFAASRFREGDFSASRLDESTHTSEIWEVNRGFNQMAQRLAKVEEDRAVMLAGISHDLRTPLTRLRLETELSVSDPEARAHMVADIGQLDAIIDKFLDYARPDKVQLVPVFVMEAVRHASFGFQDQPEVRLHIDVAQDVRVLADMVELQRILSNLLENARRYGKSPNTGFADIQISASCHAHWVDICVRDRGIGVAFEQIPELTKPFYRGEAARTAANGAGLGLAIVEKTAERMGGNLALRNGNSGGLVATITLQRATKV